MKVAEIAEIIDANILCGEENLDIEFECAFASDLMSDVLTTEVEGMLLLTGLSNLQTIRTAEMSDIHGVVIVRNKQVTEEMIELAKESGIVLFECKSSLYKVSGLLFKNGLKPVF